MTGLDTVPHALVGRLPVAHAGDVKAPAAVFQEVFTVFLGLGTLVGVVVVSYTLYNAYKYRDGGGNGTKADVERPQMGELPRGGGGGKKLFVSFFLSAAIVLGLILWTYTTLLYVEDGPSSSQQAQTQAIAQASTGASVQAQEELDPIEVDVIGHQFSWEFVYPNGHSTVGTMTVPRDRVIRLNVTSADVFHNIGIPDQRVKADAVPGQQTNTWFVAHETGEYEAKCYELCGTGHSYMNASVEVVPQAEYEQWYDETGDSA